MASWLQVAKALRLSFADITEEEEYYIGRSGAATILSTYPAVNNSRLTHCINQVGQAVILYSDCPEIFAGYHFLVLDSNEVNAMAKVRTQRFKKYLASFR